MYPCDMADVIFKKVLFHTWLKYPPYQIKRHYLAVHITLLNIDIAIYNGGLVTNSSSRWLYNIDNAMQ